MKQTAILLGGFLAVFVLFSPTVFAAPIVPGSFSTTWDTGTSDQISIGLGSCPTAVYWEEIGNESNNGTGFSCTDGTIVQFPSPGQYRVDFTGNFGRISIGNDTSVANQYDAMFRTVEQWGSSNWQDFTLAFVYVTDLTFNASDVPNMSTVTNTSLMFWGATNFNSDISGWDMSNVTDSWGMFWGATSFNQPLNNWDMSSNTRFWRMFRNASSFNQPLDNWDTSSGEDFSEMFSSATSFNQPLDAWDVSSVQYMASMFESATLFNQDLSTWNISNVTNMSNMFDNSGLSTQNYTDVLISWSQLPVQDNVSLGANNTIYLDTASSARQSLIDVYGWNIVDGGIFFVPSTEYVFVTEWDTRLGGDPNQLQIYAVGRSNANFSIDWGDGSVQLFQTNPVDYVTHTYSSPGIKTVTFTGNFSHFSPQCGDGTDFNKLIDVTSWGAIEWEYLNFRECTHVEGFSATDIPNLSNVIDTSNMFYGATSFNDDVINTWDVSSVTDMNNMFASAQAFNQPLNSWDVSSVTDMNYMFYGATDFNQSLSNWNISNVGYMDEMLVGTAFTEAKYTSLLTSWSALPLQSDVYFGTDAQYCNTAQAARDVLVANGWIITDEGATADCVIEDESESSGGSSGTRVGDRARSYFSTTTPTSTVTTLVTATTESFIAGVRKLIDYLTKNEDELANLTAAESTQLINALREIVLQLLKFLPGV